MRDDIISTLIILLIIGACIFWSISGFRENKKASLENENLIEFKLQEFNSDENLKKISDNIWVDIKTKKYNEKYSTIDFISYGINSKDNGKYIYEPFGTDYISYVKVKYSVSCENKEVCYYYIFFNHKGKVFKDYAMYIDREPYDCYTIKNINESSLYKYACENIREEVSDEE